MEVDCSDMGSKMRGWRGGLVAGDAIGGLGIVGRVLGKVKWWDREK